MFDEVSINVTDRGVLHHHSANAGLGPRADYFGTELDANGDLKEPSWDLLDVSLRGVMNTVTLAIYHYRTQEPVGGSIVVCGSTMGIQRCRAVDYGESHQSLVLLVLGQPTDHYLPFFLLLFSHFTPFSTPISYAPTPPLFPHRPSPRYAV